MKKLFSCFVLCAVFAFGEVYVTYQPHIWVKYNHGYFLGSRLGNQLITLLQAFTAAKKLNATLVYTPIQVPNLLEALKKHTKTISFEDFIYIKKVLPFDLKKIKPNEDYIYKSSFVGNHKGLSRPIQKTILKEFRQVLVDSVPGFHPPEKINKELNIAVHIRTGAGFDLPLASVQFYDQKFLDKQKHNHVQKKNRNFIDTQGKMIKLPPIQYYINSIKHIMDYYKNSNYTLRFYIFTDYLDKTDMLSKIKSAIKEPVNVFLAKEMSHTSDKLIEEILLMSSCDGLIRSESSTFSVIASLIGEHKIEIIPVSAVWIGSCMVVNKIKQVVDNVSQVVPLKMP